MRLEQQFKQRPTDNALSVPEFSFSLMAIFDLVPEKRTPRGVLI